MPLKPIRQLVTTLVAAVALSSLLLAQDAPPPPPPPEQTLSPDQLDDMVAPIALYPDELLSQVLVACTYPLEIVQAYQWLEKNPGLNGPALTQAAQQQGWDASVQALVVFPDVVKRLNDDITWTTNLGNAFLAQQQDVMDAVQRMRLKAQQAGKLQSTPQENVVMAEQNGAPVIDIEPASPDVIYVPVYDPVWIWGPAAWYPYPHWWWPPRTIVGGGLFFGFGPAINVGFYFGAGWHGWGGWGWHPGWGNRTVIVNNTFIHTNNFNVSHVTNAHGAAVWQHDPAHRVGVPYTRPELNNQYRGEVRQNLAPRPAPGEVRNNLQGQPAERRGNRPSPSYTPPPQERMGNRPAPSYTPPQQPQERMGNRQVPSYTPQPRTAFGGMNNGRSAETHAEHGYSSLGQQRSAPAPRAAPAPAPRSGGGGEGGRHR